jgi:hypothetical protein
MARIDLVELLRGMQEKFGGIHENIEKYQKTYKGFNYKNQYFQTAKKLYRQIETANKPFTVAFYGEFKVGKSTFINSLLPLLNDDALSHEDTADTATCTRITYGEVKKEENTLLYFNDGQKTWTKVIPWKEAKKYTSQVFLDKHPEFKKETKHLEEVEYKVNCDFLKFCDFLDLPGTGSRYYKEHTELTQQRLQEAELVIWLIGPEEPGAQARKELMLLRAVQGKVVPVINVWGDIDEPKIGISDKALDKIEGSIRNNFSSYFLEDSKIYRYGAKKVWQLRQDGKEIDKIPDDLGFEEFISFFSDNYLKNFQKQESTKTERILNATSHYLDEIVTDTETLIDSLDEITKSIEDVKIEIQEQQLAKHDLWLIIRRDLKDLSFQYAQDLVSRFTKASEIFINDQLQLGNFKLIKKRLKQNGEKETRDYLNGLFLNEYIQLYQKPSWMDKLLKEFVEEAKILIINRWKKFVRKYSEELASRDIDYKIIIDFDELSNQMAYALFEVLEKIIGIMGIAALLIFIPGGQIFDAVAIVGLIIWSAIKDPLKKYRNNAIKRARLLLDNQKFGIRNKMLEASENQHKQVDNVFTKDLNDQLGFQNKKYDNTTALIENLRNLISSVSDYKEDLQGFEV